MRLRALSIMSTATAIRIVARIQSKRRAGIRSDEHRADDAARQTARRQQPADLQVNALMKEEGERAARAAGDDERERRAGRLGGRDAEEDAQDRHEDKAAAEPDHRAEDACEECDGEEFGSESDVDGCLLYSRGCGCFQRCGGDLQALHVVNLDRSDLAFDGDRVELVDFDEILHFGVGRLR